MSSSDLDDLDFFVSDEPPLKTDAAAAIKVQSHVRGHLVRKRLKTEPEPSGGEGEGEPAAARASYSAAVVRGAPEVLASGRSVGSRSSQRAGFWCFPPPFFLQRLDKKNLPSSPVLKKEKTLIPASLPPPNKKHS
jgi:hypothetical protein